MNNFTSTLIPLKQCWICGCEYLHRWNEEIFDTQGLSDPIVCAYNKMSFWLNRCPECGFAQPEGLPSEPDYFDRYYSYDRSSDCMELDYSTPYKDFIFHTIVDKLSHFLPAHRRELLDVGTSVGRMLTVAKEAGWESEGIELNPIVANFAAQRTDRSVHQMNAYKLAATGRRFDAVILTDVLEHIPNPVAILKDLQKLLRPGGWIAVKVPYGLNQWRKEKIRTRLGKIPAPHIATNLGHINHFSPNALEKSLTQSGFDSIEIEVGAPEYPPLDGSLPSLISRGSRFLSYSLAQLPGGLNTPLAFNLQAYARVCETEESRS